MKQLLRDAMPATQARAEFFGLVDAAYYSNHTTKIIKNGVVMAEINPPKHKKIDWKAYRKNAQKLVGKFSQQSYQEMEKAREDFAASRFPKW